MPQRELVVWINLVGIDHLVGRLWSREGAGRATATFAYDSAWLTNPRRFDLSPMLPCGIGAHQINRALPGAFTDCAPDSWGQKLMRRGERLSADETGGTARTLFEVDFLAGVDDASRMGALRFKDANGSGNFLTSSGRPVPPLIDLPVLMGAADKVMRGTDKKRDVDIVLDPGASLGGARPKATVRDTGGHLLIAKFPKNGDDWPVIRWEAVLLDLAKTSGITTPDWKLVEVARKPVLLLNRFDRMSSGERLPFMSAMTALDAVDHPVGRSYVEIAGFIRRFSSKPTDDLAQLWRRVVFNILVSNTDDHLRNHAFLRDGTGWRLSPAYDMNPVPATVKPRIHAINISDTDATGSFELALSVAPKFGLSAPDAAAIAAEVGTAVTKWRDTAKRHKLTANQIAFMASAFDHGDIERAQKVPATTTARKREAKPKTIKR